MSCSSGISDSNSRIMSIFEVCDTYTTICDMKVLRFSKMKAAWCLRQQMSLSIQCDIQCNSIQYIHIYIREVA
jgi:hypothetical protein